LARALAQGNLEFGGLLADLAGYAHDVVRARRAGSCDPGSADINYAHRCARAAATIGRVPSLPACRATSHQIPARGFGCQRFSRLLFVRRI